MDNNHIAGRKNAIIEVHYLEPEKQFIASAKGLTRCTAKGYTPEQAINDVKPTLKHSG